MWLSRGGKCPSPVLPPVLLPSWMAQDARPRGQGHLSGSCTGGVGEQAVWNSGEMQYGCSGCCQVPPLPPLQGSGGMSHLPFRISYCTADKMHGKVFAYIAQSQHNENLECHAFLCTKRKMVSGERRAWAGSARLGSLSLAPCLVGRQSQGDTSL